MMNFIFDFCVLVTSGIQSIKEGNPAKANNLSKDSCENLPFSSATDVPPFYYFIDRQSPSRAYKGFRRSVTTSRTNRPPSAAANQLLLYGAHHQWREEEESEPRGRMDGKSSARCQGSVNCSQLNAWKKSYTPILWLEDNRKTVTELSCETLNQACLYKELWSHVEGHWRQVMTAERS